MRKDWGRRRKPSVDDGPQQLDALVCFLLGQVRIEGLARPLGEGTQVRFLLCGHRLARLRRNVQCGVEARDYDDWLSGSDEGVARVSRRESRTIRIHARCRWRRR